MCREESVGMWFFWMKNIFNYNVVIEFKESLIIWFKFRIDVDFIWRGRDM